MAAVRVDTLPFPPRLTAAPRARVSPGTTGFRAARARTPPSLANEGQELHVDTEPSFLSVPVAVQKGFSVT